MKLGFRNADGTIFEESAKNVYPRQDVIERHDGVTSCRDYVVKMTRQSDGKSIYFRHVDYNGEWGEYGILNASINDAVGYVHGDLVDLDTGRQLMPVKGIHDQTGFMRYWGVPRYAPDRELIDRYLEKRDIGKLSDRTRDAIRGKITRAASGYPGAWMRPYQPGGEDHYADTNRAGSPNACYSNRTYVAWMLDPNNPSPLITLMDWLKIQYGTLIVEEDRGVINRPGRPQLLFDFETRGFCRPYTQAMAPHRFNGYNTIGAAFGRDAIPTAMQCDLGDNRLAWLGKRLMWQSGDEVPYGGQVRFGNRISAEGWNGSDPEHDFRNHPIDALCLLTPSVFARDLRRCQVETCVDSMMIDNVVEAIPQDFDWNSRAASWRLFNFAMAGYVLRDARVAKMARVVRDWILDGRATSRDFAKPFIWAGSRGKNDGDRVYESVWQTAPGVAAAEQAEDIEQDPEEKNRWRMLREKGERILDAGVVYRDGAPIGIAKSIEIRSDGTAVPFGNEVGWMGVHHWCVAAGWRRPWAQVAWEELQRTHRYFDVEAGSEQCFEWHWRSVMHKDA